MRGWRGLLLVLGLALAWQALRGLAWEEAWRQLIGLGPRALLLLLALNLAMLPLMAARWWQLLRMLGSPVGLFTVCAYRFAANAVSYLTPGPHFGGEPLLVYLLHQRQGILLLSATTSVAIDRILELWASITVLSLSLIILTVIGSGPFAGGWALFLALLTLVALAVLLVALFTGSRPLSLFGSWLMRLCSKEHTAPFGTCGRLVNTIIKGEAMAESLLHRHRRSFLLVNMYSAWPLARGVHRILADGRFFGLSAVALPIARCGDYRAPCLSHPFACWSRCPRIRTALGNRCSGPRKCPWPQPLPAHSTS